MATQLSFLDDDEQVPNDPEWDRQEQDRNYRAYSDSRSGLLDSVNRYLDKPRNIPPDEEMRAEPVAPPTLEEDIMERVKKRLKREGVEPFKEDPGYEPDPPTDPKNAPPKNFYPMAGQPNRILQPGSNSRAIIQMIKENAGSDPLFKALEDRTRIPDPDYVAQQDWPGVPERPS